MDGFVLCYRKIWEHPIFRKRPDRVGMFLWLLHRAAWKDTKVDVLGKPLTVHRGQLCVSLRAMSEDLGVGLKVVRTFLDRLETESVVVTDRAHGLAQSRTVITICNYEKYQAAEKEGGTVGAQSGHSRGTQKKEDNNSLLRKGPSARDPSQVIFTDCLDVLTTSGIGEKQGRSLLGKWRKQHGDAAVIAATGKAQREGAVDPVGFIEGVFRQKSKAEPKSAAMRIAERYREA